MNLQFALTLVLFGFTACASSRVVHGDTAPSGVKMLRVACPSGWDDCREVAENECRNRGIRSETSGDQEQRTLWFLCLPELHGYLRETTDAQGRKAWTDRCEKRADCLADAAGVCPEGYALAYSGSGSNTAKTQATILFRCKGDGD
jgi:hypothetical protein